MGWIDKLKGQRNRSSSLRRNDDAVHSGAAGSTSSGTPGEAATLPSTAAASGGGVRGDVGSPGDVDPVLQHLIRNVRSAAVRQQFHRIPASQYQSVNEVRLLVGSYNTNGVKPPSGQPLADWLQFPLTGWPRRPAPEPGTDGTAAGPLAVPEEGPDIIVLCFQELVPLSAGNVLAGASSELAGIWDRLLDANLNSCHAHSRAQQDLAQRLSSAWRGGGQEAAEQLPAGEGTAPEYVQLVGKQLVGLYITVWLRQWLVPHVRGAQVAAVGTGAFGYLGNKGAVGVRLRVFDSPLCLVCAHLSSGQSDADALKRNQDYVDIMHRGTFPEEPASDAPPADAAAAAAAAAAAVAGDLLGIAGGGADALQTSAGVCAAPPHTGELPGQWAMRNTFAEQENIVCAGDLNYRLTLPDAEVRTLVQAGRYERLLAADQLYMFMDRGLAFQDWKEGILSFPPTYKYRRNTSLYVGDSAAAPAEADGGGGGSALDLLSSGVAAEPDLLGLGRPSPAAPAAESSSAAAASAGSSGGKQKSRTPAWTDRVLYKTVQGELHKIAYGRSELMLSDHKPVVAAFLLSARQYERGRVNAAVDMAWRAHDALEMRAKPVCRLEAPMVDLGEVRFQQQVTTRARLLNEGEVPACFYFLDQPSEHFPGGDSGAAAAEDDASRSSTPRRRICPDWMTVEPSGGIIPPGGAAEIDLTLMVEGGPLGVADTLAAAPGMRLDVILVLRIENSSDKFISLSGTFRPSCFGLSLDRMAALADPTAASGTTPAQVQRLLSYLSQPQCVGTPGLFRDSLDDVRAACCAAEPDDTQRAAMLEAPAEQLPRIVAVRQLLDDHADLAANGVSAHEAAAALMLLFRLLPAPLMPPAIVEMCEVCVPNANQAAQVLKDSLSATAWSTLRDSLRLLHACLTPEATARNCLTPSQLVDVWVSIWFPPPQYPDALSALAAARMTVAARAGDGSEEDGMSEADAQLQIRIQQAVDSASRRSQLLSLFMHPLRRAEAAQQAAGVQQQQ